MLRLRPCVLMMVIVYFKLLWDAQLSSAPCPGAGQTMLFKTAGTAVADLDNFGGGGCCLFENLASTARSHSTTLVTNADSHC